MKLSDDRARTLSRLVWRERLRSALPLVVFACGFAVLTAYFSWQRSTADPAIAYADVHGTVLDVKLDDGRDVDPFSSLGTLLLPGTHVDIAAATHASGKLTYDITRATP